MSLRAKKVKQKTFNRPIGYTTITSVLVCDRVACNISLLYYFTYFNFKVSSVNTLCVCIILAMLPPC